MTVTRLHTLAAENQAITGALQLYSGSTYPTISSTKAKTGTYSYKSTASGGAFGRTITGTAAVRCGCWLNHNGGTTVIGTVIPVLTLQVGSTAIRLMWDYSANQFKLLAGYTSGTTNARYPIADVSAGTFSSAGTWFHVGIAAKLASSDGFVSVYIDGQQIMTWTGDTQIYASGSSAPLTEITGIYALGVSSSYWANNAYIDDLYIDDATGETDYPLIGKRFLPFAIDDDGSLTQLTPNTGANYAAVAEAPNDGDTTYVKGLTAALADAYLTTNAAVPADHAPRAIVMDAAARKTEAGLDSRLTFILKNGSTTLQGTSQALSTSYAQVQERFAVDPDSAAWTAASAADVEKGYQTSGAFA